MQRLLRPSAFGSFPLSLYRFGVKKEIVLN